MQGTTGSEIHREIKLYDDFIYITKGYDPLEEAFSGFFNPQLNKILQENKIEKVLVVGLAYDFCVAHTAYDSSKLGYKTYIIKEACRHISEETKVEAENNFKKYGIELIGLNQISQIFE